jgi:hypothetical protein
VVSVSLSCVNAEGVKWSSGAMVDWWAGVGVGWWAGLGAQPQSHSAILKLPSFSWLRNVISVTRSFSSV